MNLTIKRPLHKKKPKSPIPTISATTDLEREYYQYQAYIALHTIGYHIHFKRQEE